MKAPAIPKAAILKGWVSVYAPQISGISERGFSIRMENFIEI